MLKTLYTLYQLFGDDFLIKVIKRDGRIVEFDKTKIYNAIMKSMKYGSGIVVPQIAQEIADEIEVVAEAVSDIDIHRIENIVFSKLIAKNQLLTAKSYEGYRSIREFQREHNNIEEQVKEMISGNSEYWNTENSNKDVKEIKVQRDYMAGIVSTYITKKELPPDVVEAHDAGIIHFHDMDYYAENAKHNCCVFNLNDMLQNGTVMNGKMIEKPHRLITATTIATQLITAVASSQYGGTTISLTHLAPFVRDSYNKYLEEVKSNVTALNLNDSITINEIKAIAKKKLKKEIEDSVQTFNYQINTMFTVNGQAPFLSVFMYLGETDEYKEELSMLIEEFFKQRIQGIKNESGVYITQEFPKLLYVLEPDNIEKGSKYYYLTELAAKCIAKRMTPDCISEKIMLKLKDDVYGCMGCVTGEEIITYKYDNKLYVESFKRMWDRISEYYPIIKQPNNKDDYLDTTTDDKLFIYDTIDGFVKVKKVIRNNYNKDWINIKFSNGRNLLCTPDHPIPVTNIGRKRADELKVDDEIIINDKQYSEHDINFDVDKAWLLGFLLCDGCYDNHVFSSIALKTEDDIQEKYIFAMKKCFNNDVKIIERHRGEKGNYKDLVSTGNITDIIDYLSCKFEGLTKNRRHIPNEVFSWNIEAKLAFLSGMIDADGYINPTTHGGSVVQIGSVNKELALQQMALAQSLGMFAKVYQNHYKKNSDKIRYRVEFAPTDDLIKYIISEKKKNNYIPTQYSNATNIARVNSVEKISPLNEVANYSYDVETESDHFEVSSIYSHNCRSFLTPDRFTDNGIGNIAKAKDYIPNQHKYYGRFNQGVVTINLVDVALSSRQDTDKFWEILNDRLELCHKALKCRHKKLLGTLSDVAPILWQHGALARLDKGEKIDELLYHGYSTISLGYAGLYECVKYMIGTSHTYGDGKAFGLKVMQALNDACAKWKTEEDIDYSVYGTPIEATTYKFAKCLKDRFGIIKDITDHDYITNSYHINVREEIDPFSKLSIESEFQKLSPGGAISYIETADLANNTEAVIEVLKHIYNNIMYAELNTKSDYCQVCGYDGEIKIITDEKTGKLIWECPNCHNRDQDKMNVARRTCGLETI